MNGPHPPTGDHGVIEQERPIYHCLIAYALTRTT